MLDFLRVDFIIFFEIWMEKTFISSERFEELEWREKDVTHDNIKSY